MILIKSTGEAAELRHWLRTYHQEMRTSDDGDRTGIASFATRNWVGIATLIEKPKCRNVGQMAEIATCPTSSMK